MTYSPDDDPANFNPDDAQQLNEWLEHPNTHALHDDLGRDFRSWPPADQIVVLAKELRDAVNRRENTAVLLRQADAPAEDPRRGLLTALENEVRLIGARIKELVAEL